MMAKSGSSATNTNSELAIRYVLTALGSQISGDRTLIQMPREKSYGNTQYDRHGRPVWTSAAAIVAPISEKTVSTSAARVTGRRHSA